MDQIEELLPGLEEFLTITLASESLSSFAEERRQFFIECLDIVKLPPSLPPREGRVLPPELLKLTEESSGVPSSHSIPDFAATQREISRSLVDSSPFTEDEVDGIEDSVEKVIKVYDDIDPTDSNKEPVIIISPRPLSEIKLTPATDDDNDDIEGSALYEIPVARQQLSPESQSYGADGSSMTTTESTEDLPDDVLDFTLTSSPSVPPPLPPRRDIKFSDSGSRNSINFDEKPPELPFRPPLPKRNELNPRSDKSDRSEKSNNSDIELSGEGDSTSYESFEDEEQQDPDLINRLNIQLPKKPKKRLALTKSKKLSGSRSSSQWEISATFRKLENIDISGELYYKGKLKWNRRIVAISNGCIAMYKPDKDTKPSLVIPLTGYEASVNEREGRKGFEVKMVHPNADCHSFSVDFKDWAYMWMEHINGSSKGQPPPKYHTHLARTFSGDTDSGTNLPTFGSKLNVSDDNSTELAYDEIGYRGDLPDDLFIKEEGDRDSIKSSPVDSLSSRKARTLAARHFQSEKSPLHSKRRTLMHSRKSSPFSASSRDRTISATVKDILRRRQRAMYTIQTPEPSVHVEKYTPKGDRPNSDIGQMVQKDQPALNVLLPATALSLSRWDWKSVFYNWSMPLDHLILAFRGTDLSGSTSNLSTGSDGGSEDSAKSKIKGSKVMRMGSFAFRATQFFENIGKKNTTKKKSHQTSGLNFRHSGDFTGVRDDIVEEPSVSTSHSTGNLVKGRKKTASDSSLPSVFIETENVFSHLPSSVNTSDEHHLNVGTDEADIFIDVTHKGYLHIFSSFNKRRWGKRWCLVRENMFECYKNDYSQKCELNFLLKPCALRRAITETNSERGLMIMENGREKITVEPLSNEEMGEWVRVLLAETTTQNVPEGLEEFLTEQKNSDGDGSSVISFTVLKQWDMDCLVPSKNPAAHDYEDPVETASIAAKLQANIYTESQTAFHSSTDPSNSSRVPVTPNVTISEDTVNKTNDCLQVYCKNKHTTDSGFYSAKGANSDSDSSHEVSDLDFGYAAQDSRSFYNSQHASKRNRDISASSSPHSVNKSSMDKDFIPTKSSLYDDINFDQSNEPSLSSQHVQLFHSSSSISSSKEISSKLAISTSESHLNIGNFTSNSQNNIVLDSNDDCPVPSGKQNMSKKHSNSASTVSKSGSSTSSSQTVISPSGEEYSIVLKRSERSSKSPESCSELNNSSLNTSSIKSNTDVRFDDELNAHSDNEVFSSLNYISDKQTFSNANNDNESSYYEPICALNSMDNFAADRSSLYADAELNILDNNTPDSCDEDSDHPPPIPTSPIPDLEYLPPFSVQVTPSGAHKEMFVPSLSKQSENLLELQEDSGLSKANKKKGRKSVNSNTNSNAEFSGSVHQPCCNGEQSTLDANNFGDEDVFLSTCASLESPTSDTIATIIRNPNTTVGELKDLTELLKCKQSDIKRKRLAVHDKRQRVLSDEGRLACEKEFATLEKAAETLEENIRVVQNQLDAIQGQTLETMKTTQGKNKLRSKKTKSKKKS